MVFPSEQGRRRTHPRLCEDPKTFQLQASLPPFLPLEVSDNDNIVQRFLLPSLPYRFLSPSGDMVRESVLVAVSLLHGTARAPVSFHFKNVLGKIPTAIYTKKIPDHTIVCRPRFTKTIAQEEGSGSTKKQTEAVGSSAQGEIGTRPQQVASVSTSQHPVRPTNPSVRST